MYPQEHTGEGTSDGVFRRKRYFHCHLNGAVFVPINKIKLCSDPSQYKQAGPQNLIDGAMVPEGALPPQPPLELGDRVVWMSDDRQELGTVKWIGILPDSERELEWTVGVEFVSILLALIFVAF